MGRTKKKPIRNFQENKHKKREEAQHAQLLSSVSSRLLPEQQQQVKDDEEKKEPIEIDIHNDCEKDKGDFILAQHSNTTLSTIISPNKRKRIIESSDEEDEDDEDDAQKKEDELILSGKQIRLKATPKRVCIDIKAVVESECNEASQKKDTSCLRIIASFCLKPNHTLHMNSSSCPSNISDENRENLKENDTIIETDVISAKSLLLVYFLQSQRSSINNNNNSIENNSNITNGGEDTDDDFNMIVRSKLYLKEIEPLIIAIEQQMINVYFSTTHIRENTDDNNKKASSTSSISMNVFISLTQKVFELCTPQTTNVLPLPKFEYSHHLSELLEEEKEKEGNTSKNSCNSRKQKKQKKNSPKRRKRNYNTGVGRAIVLRESLSLLLSSSKICPPPSSSSLIIDIAKNPKPSPEKITSKMIYGVIDNMHDVSEEKNQPLLDKPKNLVPTLRPYQQAALNWMLKREQREIVRMIERQDNHNDKGDNRQEQEQQAHKSNIKVEESESCWEACWLVLIMCEKKKSSIDVVDNFVTVMPLYEWKTLKEQDEETAILFYNPFIGWICESYEKAKSYTLSTCSASSTKRVKGGILCDQMGL